MRVRYKGDGTVDAETGAPTPCTAYGQTFPVGEWVEFEHLKLVANPMFDVEGAPSPVAPVVPEDQAHTDAAFGAEDAQTGLGLSELRSELDARGVAYDKRWGVKRLGELLSQQA